MKNIFKLVLTVSALSLGACAHDERPDTRAQSFAASDVDQDQKLSYGEYENYIKLESDMGNPKAQTVLLDTRNPEKTVLLKFQGRDVNRDNFVSREELGLQ